MAEVIAYEKGGEGGEVEGGGGREGSREGSRERVGIRESRKKWVIKRGHYDHD